MNFVFNFNLALAAVLWVLLLPAAAAAQPQLTLPSDEVQPGIPRPKALQLPRENQIEVPLSEPAMQGTAVGGYGEITVNAPSNGPAVVDMRRLVLYFGHNFNQHIRFYSELEVEHAVTSAEDKGEFEVEQAFLDWVQWHALNFRAGIIIVPVGIINVYHEPPTFNGVDRPLTDQLVIPSTWREPGAGVFGEYAGIRYQAYAVNGFNAKGFNATTGLREGHQEGSLAFGQDWGIALRADYLLPFLYKAGISADVGASFYYANADQGQPEFRGSQGDSVPVTLVEADLRMKTRGFELRAEIASVWIGGIHRLNRGLADIAMADMVPFDGPVSHQLIGGYVEAGYDVLHPFKLVSARQLVPFLRYEHVDTQYDVAADLGGRVPGNKQDVLTAGLTFRPISEIALKFDYQHFWTDATDPAKSSFDSWNFGLAFMF